MRSCLAISTYVGNNPALAARLRTILKSLQNTEFDGRVVIVDDGSRNLSFIRYLNKLPYEVHFRQENGGIARTKNTCLCLMRSERFDIGFLADDDIEFRPGWYFKYREAYQRTGIQHFSWSSDFYDPEMRRNIVKVNGYEIARTNKWNGPLLAVTESVIKNVGGFKILPAKWGYEHINFSERCIRAGMAPFPCDIVDSNRYVDIGRHQEMSTVSAQFKIEAELMNRDGGRDYSQVYFPIET